LWQRLFGHEITVTNVDPFGETVVWNLTGNPIEVETVSIVSAAPKDNLVWEVHKTIPANAEEQISLLEVAAKSWYGSYGEMFGKAPAGFAKLDPATFEQLKQNMFRDKYVPTYLMPESASYAQLKKELGAGFQSFDCIISVGFTRLLDGSSSSFKLPCKGVFRYRDNKIEIAPTTFAGVAALLTYVAESANFWPADYREHGVSWNVILHQNPARVLSNIMAGQALA
jgi:hypothetical protein